jgi:hypothetical protein
LKRLIDINGDVIIEPENYHESLKWGREMIALMEDNKVDRSDMLVIVNKLYEEMCSSLVMLPDRQYLHKQEDYRHSKGLGE